MQLVDRQWEGIVRNRIEPTWSHYGNLPHRFLILNARPRIAQRFAIWDVLSVENTHPQTQVLDQKPLFVQVYQHSNQNVDRSRCDEPGRSES
jgi:hypothetical protein